MNIEVGDFIKAKDVGLVGKVIKIGSIKFGKKKIPGYLIETATGKVDFIDNDSAVLLGGAK
jgi:hypothetical protein